MINHWLEWDILLGHGYVIYSNSGKFLIPPTVTNHKKSHVLNSQASQSISIHFHSMISQVNDGKLLIFLMSKMAPGRWFGTWMVYDGTPSEHVLKWMI